MPIVPSYQSQVISSNTPTVRANESAPIETFGGGAGLERSMSAAQGLIKQSNDLFQQQRKEADDAAGMGHFAALAKAKNDLLYNEKTGALARKGADALDINREYLESFDKQATDLEANAGNDQQRMMIRQMKAKMGTELSDNLQKHTFGESEGLKKQMAETALDAAHEDAVMNFQNPGKLDESLKIQEGIAYQVLSQQGVHGELADFKVHEIKSKTYTSVIDRMVSMGNDRGAKTMYDELKSQGQLTSRDDEGLMKTLDVATTRGEAQRTTDEIVSKTSNMGAALAAANDKYKDDIKLRDETRSRIKQAFADRESSERMAQEDAHEKAYSIAEKTRDKTKIPDALWASMSPTQRSNIDAYLKKDDSQGDPAFYEELKLGLANPETRSKYMRMDANDVRHRLSASQFKEFVSDKIGFMKDDPKTKAKLDGFMSDTQTIDQMLGEVNIDPKSERARQFKAKLDRLVIERQESTGKKVNNDELRKLSNTLLIEGITSKGMIWDSKARAFELTNGQEFQDVVVPDTDTEEITVRFKNKFKREPSRQEIVQRYLKGKALGG